MPKKPKVYFKLWPGNEDDPTRRRRGLYVCEGLRRLGWDVTHDLSDDCQIAVLQRIVTPSEIRGLQARGVIVCMETNDCLILKGTQFYVRTDWESASLADYVIVSSRWMQRLYARANPRCLIATEMLEADLWRVPPADLPNDPLVLSWHGLGDNVRIYLDPLMKEIGPLPNVRLRLVTNPMDSKRRDNRELVQGWPIPVDFVEWRLETFAFEMTRAHAGIVLLPSTAFASGKGPHKALAYFCAGLPVVASNVPPYREVIKHGETGLLADSPEEFRKCIEKLRNPVLREKLGSAGRGLSRYFDSEHVSALWDKLLWSVWERREARAA